MILVAISGTRIDFPTNSEQEIRVVHTANVPYEGKSRFYNTPLRVLDHNTLFFSIFPTFVFTPPL